MIKKTYCFLIILLFTQFVFSQSEDEIVDYKSFIGLQYEISNNLNWGYGEPVITYIIPESPAEKAGLKENDIIMEIYDNATFLRPNCLINNLLFNHIVKETLDITIRDFGNSFASKTIKKSIVSDIQISERELAIICSPYDFENSRIEKFTIPINIKTLNNENVDYSDFYSFGFDNNKIIDPIFKQKIIELMKKKGLKYNSVNPDFYIQLSFSYKKIDKLEGDEIISPKESNNIEGIKRFLFEKDDTSIFPITDSDYNNRHKGEISLIFYETNIVEKDKKTKIWEATISEFFTGNISENIFMDTYIPLMLMSYPYVSNCNSITFEFEKRKYLYTGIQYNSLNLPKIIDVDIDSPAYKSGIRRNQMINKIQKKDMCQDLDVLLFDVNLFKNNTLGLRDEKNGLYNDNFDSDINRFWNQGSEKELTKIFKDKNYNTVFSYIYDYNTFINPKYDGIIEFEIIDNGKKYKRLVRAENKQENRIRIINYDTRQ